ncbi:Scr1 family TA system antitoxin-like transcriptional regulator [Streptomyces xiamenensis]|uniref:Scr1 family TA system antitoxin-like transcriptional regulator n=1 Tax=Streptomyces xiamenensis TaxID=408015 RepID=UPI0035E35A85
MSQYLCPRRPARPVPVAARRIGAQLAVLRLDANLDVGEAAQVGRIRPEGLLAAEYGEEVLGRLARNRLLNAYRATEQQREDLASVLRILRAPDQDWTDDGRGHRRRRAAIEAPAQLMRIWVQTKFPAILRTPSYARVVDRHSGSVDERDLAAATARSEVFAAGRAGRAVVLLEEPFVRRVVGSRAVMAEQLAHLLHLQDTGLIGLRVLPAAARVPPHPPVVQLDFGSGRGRLAYGELELCTVYHTGPSQLDEFQQGFAGAWKRTLSLGESRELIAAAITHHQAGW